MVVFTIRKSDVQGAVNIEADDDLFENDLVNLGIDMRAKVPLLDSNDRLPDRFVPASFITTTEAIEKALEVGSQLLVQKGNVSGTLDLSTVTTNQIVHLTRVGNIVVNLPTSPIVGQTITLVMKKDATATVYSFNLKNVITAYGVSITPSPAANALDEIMCFYDGVRWKARVSGLSDAIPTAWVVS